MNDFTVAPANKEITVLFHGTPLTVITTEAGLRLVAMRPICDAIGLQWEAQLKRIRRTEVLNSTVSMMDMVAADGKSRQLLCLPLDYLNGWLFGIEVNRAKPEIRERLKEYQRECYQALHAYWNDGVAINPRTAYAVNPGDKLTAEEAETLRLMLKSAVDRQPKEKQGALMMQGWSKLKAHFKVGYREIPRHEFSEAVSIIARHTAEFAEWEVADDEQSSAPTMFGRQWLVSTDMNGKETVRPVAPDQFVKSFREIARGIAVGDMELSTTELIDLASACNQRLVHRLGNPALVLAV